MSSNGTIGILKFFRDRDKMDLLLNGLFYCNTPEYYRLSGDEGISDVNESCNHSYREGRDSDPVKLSINGHELEGLTGLTMHNNGIKDKYLHCWFAIRIPEDDRQLDTFTKNINRMRNEFGNNYAFIRARNIGTLVNRLKQYTTEEINYGNVKFLVNSMAYSHNYS